GADRHAPHAPHRSRPRAARLERASRVAAVGDSPLDHAAQDAARHQGARRARESGLSEGPRRRVFGCYSPARPRRCGAGRDGPSFASHAVAYLRTELELLTEPRIPGVRRRLTPGMQDTLSQQGGWGHGRADARPRVSAMAGADVLDGGARASLGPRAGADAARG